MDRVADTVLAQTRCHESIEHEEGEVTNCSSDLLSPQNTCSSWKKKRAPSRISALPHFSTLPTTAHNCSHIHIYSTYEIRTGTPGGCSLSKNAPYSRLRYDLFVVCAHDVEVWSFCVAFCEDCWSDSSRDVDMAGFNLILAIDVGKKRGVIELEELWLSSI